MTEEERNRLWDERCDLRADAGSLHEAQEHEAAYKLSARADEIEKRLEADEAAGLRPLPDAVTAHAREVWEQADWAKTAKLSSGWSSSEDAAVAIIAAALLAATREAEAERDRLLVLEKDLNIFLNQQCDARLKAEAKADAALAQLESPDPNRPGLLNAYGRRAYNAGVEATEQKHKAQADAARREQRERDIEIVRPFAYRLGADSAKSALAALEVANQGTE